MEASQLNIKSHHVQCRCNTAIKAWSIRSLEKLGYTPSQAYSRFRQTYIEEYEDGEGVITRIPREKGLISLYDKETLQMAQELTNLVMRFSYNYHVDNTLSRDMDKLKVMCLDELTKYMDSIEHGSKPRYLMDVEPHHSRNWIQAEILTIITMQSGFPEEVIDNLIMPADVIGEKDPEKPVKLTKEQIDTLMEIITPDNLEQAGVAIRNGMDDAEGKGLNPKIAQEGSMPFLDRWSIRVQFSGKRSNSKWIREHLELIYEIPSISKESERAAIESDIKVLREFMKEKESLKGRETELSNEYHRIKKAGMNMEGIRGKYRDLYAESICQALAAIDSFQFLHVDLGEDGNPMKDPLFQDADFYARKLAPKHAR